MSATQTTTPNSPIDVRVNEQPERLPAGTRVLALRRARAPRADVVIVNGFPAADDVADHVVPFPWKRPFVVARQSSVGEAPAIPLA